MKKKTMNKIKARYSIACIFVISSLFMSCSINASTIKIETNDEVDPEISICSKKEINLGSIYLTQSSEPHVTLSIPQTYFSEEVSGTGETITVKVYYEIICPGTADWGEVSMWYWNDDHKQITVSASSGGYKEGWLEMDVFVKSDNTFHFSVKGYIQDWWGAPGFVWWRTKAISIYGEPHIPQPALMASGEIKGTNLKPLSQTNVGTDVQIWNGGEPGSKVHWGYSEDRLYGDWDIYPGSGWLTVEDGKQSLEIWITLPEGAKDYNDNLRIYNIDDPDNDYIDIPINLKVKKSKSTTRQSYALLEKLSIQYPLLQQLLQKLPALQ